MPFGTLTLNNRLGVANLSTINASSFVTSVLKMPADTLIYQQQLVHGNIFSQGPDAAADWGCLAPDSDTQNSYTIRQISGHDLEFGHRNFSYQAIKKPLGGGQYQDIYPAYWQVGHRQTYTNQLYYLCNEPEKHTNLAANWCATNYTARNRSLEASIESVFPQPGYLEGENNVNANFWQTVFQDPDYPHPLGIYRRISPAALAYAFLRFKQETESEGRSNYLMPPAMESIANLGNAQVPERRDYWKIFLDYILRNGYGGYAPISVGNLNTLHGHYYHADPAKLPGATPLYLLSSSVNFIRRGVDWFRYEYCNNGLLPTDILLSETGHDWRITGEGRSTAWSGGWSSFKKGLTSWNTYLSWLTRRAPTECQLSGGKALYACPHSAAHPPYACDWGEVTIYGAVMEPDPQTFTYLNFDNVRVESFFNTPVIRILTGVSAEGRYLDRFTIVRDTYWGGRTWMNAPLGVCFATWAQVANDANNTAFGQGWCASSAAGTVGTANLNLQVGWNTIYIAVMKIPNQPLATNTTFNFIWSSSGVSRSHGYMNMDEFDPPYAWTYTHPVTQQQSTEYVRSSMIFPVLCYTSQARTVTLQAQRNYSGGSIWLSRPIVLPVGCTWFRNQ